MIYAGIDPSADPHCLGVAFFDDKTHTITADTFAGGSMGMERVKDLLGRATVCVVEKPMLYGGHPRPNDIVTLAVAAGEMGGIYRAVSGREPTYVKPYEWKRQLDKPKCWTRVLTLLDEREMLCLGNLKHMTKKRREDVQDAIGLALFGAGRYVF